MGSGVPSGGRGVHWNQRRWWHCTVNVLSGPEWLMSCRASVTSVNVFNLRTVP